jgi:hypothetical protein
MNNYSYGWFCDTCGTEIANNERHFLVIPVGYDNRNQFRTCDRCSIWHKDELESTKKRGEIMAKKFKQEG